MAQVTITLVIKGRPGDEFAVLCPMFDSMGRDDDSLESVAVTYQH